MKIDSIFNKDIFGSTFIKGRFKGRFKGRQIKKSMNMIYG